MAVNVFQSRSAGVPHGANLKILIIHRVVGCPIEQFSEETVNLKKKIKLSNVNSHLVNVELVKL